MIGANLESGMHWSERTLNKIGLPYPAVIYITQAAPDSMTWLSVADAAKRGIDVELGDHGFEKRILRSKSISGFPARW